MSTMTGAEIKALRVGLKLSLREFAGVVDLSYGSIASWEKGRAVCPVDAAGHIRARAREYALTQVRYFQEYVKIHRL